MMTSDKERREVAARLRTAAKTKSNRSDYLWRRLEIAVNGWKFGDAINDSYTFNNDVLARLADLIDPTCEMEAAGNVPALVKDNLETFFCSECGSPIYNDVNPSYCPYCGARVVDDDGQD